MGEELTFDALVIGAGAGGVCAAARLSHLGYRTLLVEALGRIGGRASTRDVNGFLCNTGALIIETDGMVAQTYRDLGIALSLYDPGRASTVLRVGNRDVNIVEGLGGWARDAAPSVLRALSATFSGFRPKDGETVDVWLGRFTRNKAIHGLVENAVGAMFAATNAEFRADVFLHYFTKGTGFKRVGMPVGGTVEVWKPLVARIGQAGGEVWLDAPVKKLTFDGEGCVDGALIERDGQVVRVRAGVVVSNTGPDATLKLAGAERFPEGYGEAVAKGTDNAAIITAHFASPTPLASFPCLMLPAKSRRLVYAANFSAPELKRAPEGWHLYCGASVPKPARGRFDEVAETELLMADLEDHFPGFDREMVVAVDVTAHDWPAQRAITGNDLPQATPIRNLWNVGDGVKSWGEAGTAACAETARLVVQQIAAQRRPAFG